MVVGSAGDGEHTDTATTTTITTHLLTASAVAAAEVAADEVLCVSESWSTVVLPTGYARSAYSQYAGCTPSSGPVLACPVREAVG